LKKRMIAVLATLIISALVTGCFLSGTSKQPAQQETKKAGTGGKVIKIASVLNDQHPANANGTFKFKEIVETKTKGKYEIQVYSGNQLGDDVKATQNVRAGSIEMVLTSAAPVTGMAPEFMVFDLPFILTSDKAVDAIFDGPVGKKLAGTLDSKGLHLLAYYENGFRQLTNSAKEVKSPADLSGLKIRTMENPIHLATWRALGANPTPMPFSELFTAMQQKTIDGQENPIPTIYLLKFYEVQKYATLTGHVYTPFILLINSKLWESLPPEDRKIFEEAAQESAKLERAANRKMNSDQIGELKKVGMTITELSAEQLKAFQDAVAPVYKEFEGKIGKELVEEFRKTAQSAK
jgi:tripartite ATP-independent transporter DctP family solute receptor